MAERWTRREGSDDPDGRTSAAGQPPAVAGRRALDGKLVVIGAASSLIAPIEERAELQDVIDSLVIEP